MTDKSRPRWRSARSKTTKRQSNAPKPPSDAGSNNAGSNVTAIARGTQLPPPVPTPYQTVTDTIVHDAPPPVVIQGCATANTATLLHLKVAQRGAAPKAEPQSWLSSIVAHLVAFIIIALLLVPADFGGSDQHELILTLGDATSPGNDQGVAVEITAQPDIDMVDVVDVAPVVTAPDGGQPLAAAPLSASQGGGSKSQGEKGPRGSFFGIEVDGHQFVYILDMSGSMRGKRYQLASQELIRSVDGLTDKQKFYVLLFSDGAVQMFDVNSTRPTPVSASLANKQRLRKWLPGAYGAGGTDPRAALRIALQMNPSAIFMLSDGEFKEKNNGPRSPFIETKHNNSFDLVRQSLFKPPIHSIAFQDPGSSENMKRLSVITSGQYRFVGNQNEARATASLRTARDMMRSGKLQGGVSVLEQIYRHSGATNAGWQARRELARYRIAMVERYLHNDSDEKAIDYLSKAISYDPRAIVTEDLQREILTKATHHTKASDPAFCDRLIKMLGKLQQTHHNIETPGDVLEPFFRSELNSTQAAAREGNLIAALVRLESLRRATDPPLVNEIAAAQNKLTNSIFARADSRRKSSGNSAYADLLKGMIGKDMPSHVRAEANGRLNALVLELRKQVREATKTKDSEVIGRARQNLDEVVAVALQARKVATADPRGRERKAFQLLRNAEYTKRRKGSRKAQPRFEAIIAMYPETVAAKQAKVALANDAYQRRQDSAQATLKEMVGMGGG